MQSNKMIWHVVVLVIAVGMLSAGSGAQQRIQSTRNAQLQIVQKEVVPPGDIAFVAQPNAVVLRPGSTDAILKALTVKRRYQLTSLRSNPDISLGRSRVDLRPVFANPESLINIEDRLRAKPSLAEVVSQDTQVFEVQQGLIIKQYLNYKLKPGVCANAALRAQLQQTGVQCFDKVSDAGRSAAYANPKSSRYIANSEQRAKAIENARKEANEEQQEFSRDMNKLRTMLEDPKERAKVVAEVGAAEADRLAGLSDDELEAELINTAEIKIEEVMFVPSADKSDADTGDGQGFHIPKMQKPETVEVEHKLHDTIFITGFTLGKDNEWRKRVSITVKACLVGCKRTYYIELYAGFGYGFGLRFPVEMGGLYAYSRYGSTETASIAPVFAPINGNSNDYLTAGMPSDQVFGGQELVAEFNAYAGMAYKVPFHRGGVRFDVGTDLTRDLPAPYTNGQFRPPAPGEANPPDLVKIFDQPDLIGGRASFGIAGAKILPAVKVGLASDVLKLTLKDNLSGIETVMDSSGKTYPLKVNPVDHSSSFSIGYPEYRLTFTVTPGIDARPFVDVAVWEHHWDWTVWFPAVSVELPPGDKSFKCHAYTTCSRNFRYSPTIQQEQEGETEAPPESQPIEREVFFWRKAFNKKYMGQCPQESLQICKTAINAVLFTTGNKMQSQLAALAQYPSNAGAAIVIKNTIEADKMGKGIILEARVRAIETYGNNLIDIYVPIWSNGCIDQMCRNRITAMGGDYVNALMSRQENRSSLQMNEVVSEENLQGNWAGKARKEVDDSKVRAAALSNALQNRKKTTLPSRTKKKMVIPPRQ